jgi:hypothetical protein
MNFVGLIFIFTGLRLLFEELFSVQDILATGQLRQLNLNSLFFLVFAPEGAEGQAWQLIYFSSYQPCWFSCPGGFQKDGYQEQSDPGCQL